MGKMKNKKPNSWKPSPTIQKDGFVSKNKKRKEKRMQEKLMAERTENGDFIPVRKNALKPLQVSGLSGKKQLSTSLPIKSGKKEKPVNPNNSMAALSALAGVKTSKKVTGILSNPNTPKRSKNEHVTFAVDKKAANAKKFLDDEAEEGEEPIVNKEVKPYQKKGLNKKPEIYSSDESEDEEDDDDGSVDAEDFLDVEASEGEETDDEDDDDDDDSDADDSDDFSDEDTYLSSFINDDSDDEDDSDEDEDDEEPAPKVKLNKKEKKNEIPTPSKPKKSVDLTPSTKKINPPTPSSKAKIKTEELNTTAPAKLKEKPAELATPSKVNVKAEEKNVEKKKQKKSENDAENEVDKPSNFIGFIRRLPNTVTEKDIKSVLLRVLEKDAILKIMFAKIRKGGASQNAFVYMKDAKSLGNVMHEKFDIAGSLFAVYRARSSAAEESPPAPPEPVAFLPRVPQWITEEELKNAVEEEIGVGKVTKLKDKKFIKALQTRNVLMSFVDAEALREAILKNEFKIKNHTVIVREAMEGVQVPMYRVVFVNVPEGTNEATLKKAVEGSIGKNTVSSVRFSFRKNSYAFVVLRDEEAMKKALALVDGLSLKGIKMRVQPYTPRKPRKRAPPNEHAKAKRAAKRKLKSQSAKNESKGSAESQQQPSPKKQKLETKESSNVEVAPNASNSPGKPKKRRNKKKKSNVASPTTGEVKAKKNPKMKQKNAAKPAAASPSKDGKISPLKNKIQAKMDKLKGEKAGQQKKKNKNKRST